MPAPPVPRRTCRSAVGRRPATATARPATPRSTRSPSGSRSMSTSAAACSGPRSTTRRSRPVASPAVDDVAIRPVGDADLEGLVDIYLAGARHHAAIDPDAFRVPDREDVVVRLQRRLDNAGADHAYLAAIVDGRLVGSATMDVD